MGFAQSATGLKRSSPVRSKGKRSAGGGGDMSEPLKWYDDNADNPPWIKALAEGRRLAPRGGWCYRHVQAIIVSIDQYAEAALGNRGILLEQASQHWRWKERSHPLTWLGHVVALDRA